MASSSRQCIGDLEVVERDPTGRYVRYDEIIGKGSSKTVYKGFDEVNGIEIAWCNIKLPNKIVKSRGNLESLCGEANLFKSLRHENIARCYYSWLDYENKTIYMITEIFTSGNVMQYLKKHNLADNRAIKNWGRQILTGLDYLHHCHVPPIIHRRLKCENVFVDGKSGRVKIGLALDLEKKMTILCVSPSSPEYLAPELMRQQQNPRSDIYSFGMSFLQMITQKLPYSECRNLRQVNKKVISGVMPAALEKMTEPQVKQIILRCLGPVSGRPAAIDLLNDPFFAQTDSGTLDRLSDLSLGESVCSLPISPFDRMRVPPAAWPASPVELVKEIKTGKKMCRLIGKMENDDSILMTLLMGELGEDFAASIKFKFELEFDTAVSITEEMVKKRVVSTGDAAPVAELINQLITDLVPDSSSCSPSSPNTEVDFNIRNLLADKPLGDDSDEHHGARQLLNTSGEQAQANQHNRIALDQANQHNRIALDPANLSSRHNQGTKQEQRGDYENAAKGNREFSKKAVKKYYSGLRKLLVLFRNKSTAKSE